MKLALEIYLFISCALVPLIFVRIALVRIHRARSEAQHQQEDHT